MGKKNLNISNGALEMYLTSLQELFETYEKTHQNERYSKWVLNHEKS